MTRTNRSPRDRYYDEKGFALGTAILTVTDLKQLVDLVAKVVDSLRDPTSAVLRDRVQRRLEAAGIDIKSHTPIRSFANRSIIDPEHVHSDTLAHPEQSEHLEKAISQRRAIRLQLQHQGTFRKRSLDTRCDFKEVWPLQILFHNIAWYLAYESKEPQSLGLLVVTRLDRLRLAGELPEVRDGRLMTDALQRLQLLCRRCGGIYFTNDLHQQQDVLRDLLDLQRSPDSTRRAQSQQDDRLPSLHDRQLDGLCQRGAMTRVRFRCTPEVFTFMREGFNRYPPEQMRLSGPRPGDAWTLPDVGIKPLSPLLEPDVRHPYPVEFILPSWTVDKDIDFRRWLFGFDSRIVIDAPASLRHIHEDYGAGIAALYAAPAADLAAEESPAANPTAERAPPTF
jgi:hypothetical protein